MITKEQAQRAADAMRVYGSQREAAASLGLARSTFQNHLRKAESLTILDAHYDAHAEKLLLEESDKEGFVADDCAFMWVKTKRASYFVRRPGAVSYAEMRDQIIEDMQKHAPDYSGTKEVAPAFNKHLLVVNPADVHIGKLCTEAETGFTYDHDIAINRLNDGTARLISKASAHGIGQVLYVIGNDLLHIDTPRRTTTSGTPQDTSGAQWWEAFTLARKAIVHQIETLAQYVPVHVIYNPSNHDFMSGYMLADSVYSWFHEHPNVTFGKDQSGVSMVHRKYVEWGRNLLGFTHGDGAKTSDLPNLMQLEAREAWGRSRFGYWYTAHVHHKDRSKVGRVQTGVEKDHIGVTVLNKSDLTDTEDSIFIETLRSPSPPDRWHSTNGYVNHPAMEVFLHHPHEGQVARFTEFF